MFAPAFPQETKDRVAPEDANEARLNRLQPPGQVMDIIGAAAGMTIAGIGAGRGRHIVHLADRVGPTGKIYAEDIDELTGAFENLEQDEGVKQEQNVRVRRTSFSKTAEVDRLIDESMEDRPLPGALHQGAA